MPDATNLRAARPRVKMGGRNWMFYLQNDAAGIVRAAAIVVFFRFPVGDEVSARTPKYEIIR
jgi:hypothetical protein